MTDYASIGDSSGNKIETSYSTLNNYTVSGSNHFVSASTEQGIDHNTISVTPDSQGTSTSTGPTPSSYTFQSVDNQGGLQVTADINGTMTDMGIYQQIGFSNTDAMWLSDGSTGACYLLSATPLTPNADGSYNSVTLGANGTQGNFVGGTTACFVDGTLIRTPAGDVPVETLMAGDRVVTASGAIRPVRWVGQSLLHCAARASGTHESWPVRIAAHAFAPGRPERDLLVSPGHGIAVTVMDEVLVPAFQLVNGTTITQVPCDRVSYRHIELDSHDLLISNGLPSESYMDVGNRAAFAIGFGRVDPERTPATLADYARPFIDGGPVIDAIRSRLTARAQAMGWKWAEHDMDPHLVVDGRRIDATRVEGGVQFRFPATAHSACLVSETFVPANGSDCHDHRTLGLSVSGLYVHDGLHAETRIDLDHAALAPGFHSEEANDGVHWRWTRGTLTLSPSLWAECATDVMLRIDCTYTMRRWMAPAGTVETGIAHVA
ncbi:hypothetical protein SXCC_01727 [Gluconacetobacter sp. SXCC-1]|uniref:Hint domain-containing protein n=1 Tax=Komagataeibacter rhaeticus TaxID=215221 RepID=UPI0002080197|nr:Hint domain-containing protein [Komagataeibacter rhaeticus]ATU71656.1 hypothetical protein CT154_01190 [Komagataeibacter xylinus]EGG77338.1 hypothetical protein SXCC_01727 [Gluconacetobacter sp. SXCC-1]WPP21355.1 Hint domain-containing protein [Komagataeibacter rhaeticus]